MGGQTCVLAVRFVPQGAGPAPSAELEVESSDGSFVIIGLAGTGI